MAKGKCHYRLNPPDLSPVQLAIDCIDEAEKLLGASITDAEGWDYLDALICVTPGIKTVTRNEASVYYRLTFESAHWLAVQATGDPDAMAALRRICAANVWAGEPVPRPLRALCREAILGRKSGGRRTGPLGGQKFGAFLIGFDTANYLKDLFDAPLTRGDGFDEVSVADWVAEAFTAKGMRVKDTLVRDWLTHQKHQKNRRRADAIMQFLRTRILEDLGVVKPRREWVIGPGAMLWPIGRMRS